MGGGAPDGRAKASAGRTVESGAQQLACSGLGVRKLDEGVKVQGWKASVGSTAQGRVTYQESSMDIVLSVGIYIEPVNLVVITALQHHLSDPRREATGGSS